MVSTNAQTATLSRGIDLWSPLFSTFTYKKPLLSRLLLIPECCYLIYKHLSICILIFFSTLISGLYPALLEGFSSAHKHLNLSDETRMNIPHP